MAATKYIHHRGAEYTKKLQSPPPGDLGGNREFTRMDANSTSKRNFHHRGAEGKQSPPPGDSGAWLKQKIPLIPPLLKGDAGHPSQDSSFFAPFAYFARNTFPGWLIPLGFAVPPFNKGGCRSRGIRNKQATNKSPTSQVPLRGGGVSIYICEQSSGLRSVLVMFDTTPAYSGTARRTSQSGSAWNAAQFATCASMFSNPTM